MLGDRLSTEFEMLLHEEVGFDSSLAFGSVKDFETFSRQTGHALLSQSEANGEFTFLMRKK